MEALLFSFKAWNDHFKCKSSRHGVFWDAISSSYATYKSPWSTWARAKFRVSHEGGNVHDVYIEELNLANTWHLKTKLKVPKLYSRKNHPYLS